MLYQLSRLGLDRDSTQLLKNLISGHVSHCDPIVIPILAGVLQGSMLSPQEFNAFMAGLELPRQHGTLALGEPRIPQVLYVDDRTLLADNHRDAQELTNATANWSDSVEIKHNPQKCDCVVIRGSTPNPSPVYMGTEAIPLRDEAKILGLVPPS
mmetsp:Transcript_33409/g.93766  ORF Transcript_33409/g.93766 Transcript_33409/m.93766 type:complete len:154 (+) Transcript_33409:419-880(+)